MEVDASENAAVEPEGTAMTLKRGLLQILLAALLLAAQYTALLAPAILTKSATLIFRLGSDLEKITLSLISRSSGLVLGKAGWKLPRCVADEGFVADSSIFCFNILAAWRTAQPLTDILLDESGVIL